MTVEKTYVYSGLQTGVVMELNSKGRPKAPNTGLAYVGMEVYAIKAYAPTLPSPRLVPHTGNDRLLKTQVFPGQEAASAQFSVGAEDLDLIAMVTGLTVKEIAGMKMLPHLTDKQGRETSVGVILHQAALSKETSAPGYHFHFISKSRMVAVPPGGGEAPIDFTYNMTINPSENYLWGAPLAPLSDIYDPLSGVSETGAFEAGIFSGFAENRPRIAAFLTQTAQTEFLFPDSMQAVNNTDIAVFTALPTDDFAEEVDASDYTADTDGIVFDTTPAGKEVIVVYQQAPS